MNTYFETSALVKLLTFEGGYETARDLWHASHLVVTSRLSYVESRAALARGYRSRRFGPKHLASAKAALEARLDVVEMVDSSAALISIAGDLAERHGLRGYDAVHLASALAYGPADTTVVTWDRDLADAAHSYGFDVAGVEFV